MLVLKVMHIVHHNSGRELLYRLPVAINELFHRIETDVFGAIDGMKTQGFASLNLEPVVRPNTPSPSSYVGKIARLGRFRQTALDCDGRGR